MTMLSQNVNQIGAMEVQQDVMQEERPSDVNVGNMERLVTGAVGAMMLSAALRRTMPGFVIAGVGGMLLYRAASGHCSMYEKLGINTAENQDEYGAEPQEYFNRSIQVCETLHIQKTPDELYNFWRDFENLPRFMHNLESVKRLTEIKSHWVAVGPAGYRVEWDAEIINDEPYALIAWRSLGNADVDNAGSVRFVPTADGGTDVKVSIDYIPPAGQVGHALARLFGSDPQTQIKQDLQRFKHLMEAAGS